MLLLAAIVASLSAVVSADFVKEVLYISMNHLDIGFVLHDPEDLGLASTVFQRYIDEYFPRAIATAAELRERNLTYVYTTHSYLIDMYLNCETAGFPVMSDFAPPLECPDAAAKAALVAAMGRGDIVMHAFPFNGEVEGGDASLFQAGLELTKRVSPTNTLPLTMRLTDVPGTTRGILPILVAHNISLLATGVNPGSAPPGVPRIFRWKDVASGAEVVTAVHPGMYGGITRKDCIVIEGVRTAVCEGVRGDNRGGPTTEQVMQDWAEIQEEFPDAVIRGAGYDEFVAVLTEDVVAELEVVTSEIGDTWLYGLSSDPMLVQESKMLMRARLKCLSEGDDIATYVKGDRLLLNNLEHTNGLDVKVFLNDFETWSNEDLKDARMNEEHNFMLMEASWEEQRRYVRAAATEYREASECMAAAIDGETGEAGDLIGHIMAIRPDEDGFSSVSPGAYVDFSSASGDEEQFSIKICEDGGSLCGIKYGDMVLDVEDGGFELMKYAHVVYSEDDYVDFVRDYNLVQEDWIFKDFGKPNCTDGGARSATFVPKLVGDGMLVSKVGNNHVELRGILTVDQESYEVFGGISGNLEVWYNISIVSSTEIRIDSALLWDTKTSSRLPESHMASFNPGYWPGNALPCAWFVDKLGTVIDVADVVQNGSQVLHGVGHDGAACFFGGDNKVGMQWTSKDVTLTRIDNESRDTIPSHLAFPTPIVQTGNPLAGDPHLHAIIFDSMWGTNFPQWYPFNVTESPINLFRFSTMLYLPEPVVSAPTAEEPSDNIEPSDDPQAPSSEAEMPDDNTPSSNMDAPDKNAPSSGTKKPEDKSPSDKSHVITPPSSLPAAGSPAIYLAVVIGGLVIIVAASVFYYLKTRRNKASKGVEIDVI